MKEFFTKEVCIIFSYLVLFLPIVIILITLIIKSKDTKKRKYYFYFLVLYTVLFNNFIPKEKVMDMIPIQRNNIEDAFNFDFNYDYKLAFKKRYKNTYFTMGISTYSQGAFDKFGFYKKTKYGWRTLIQPSDGFTGYQNDDGYQIYYFNNKSDNVTGIFISQIGSETAGFGEKVVIKDKYGTNFDYIKDKNNKPIIYKNLSNYIYFGIIKHNIDKNYYVEINGSKIKIK